ncbi:MAG: type I-F CRISPR-associated endoribonuclease Cas6/Csy4 [Candidatus Nitrospinota bacterium M3_3B_026]
MDHYIEIAILPDPEFTTPALMGVLFGKLHKALTNGMGGKVGISFPDMDQEKPSLGSQLRLHGEADDLNRLMATGWLANMQDHIKVDKMSKIPSNARHRVVRRVQAKSSPERLRRRMVKRKGVSETEARQAIPDNSAKWLNLPFLNIRSKSTGQAFRLFIEHGPIQSHPVSGEFSRYGLSSTITIPWF